MSNSLSPKGGFFSNLKSDLPASIVVFLVAMPLCLGIALASGAPLFSGIIAGIIGGTVVALASGSPLGVSGPAAGLAVIVFNAIEDLGAFETFLLAVVFAGIIQAILGFLRAGIIGYYFPNSVIKGMLAGIGILIFLKQIPHAFGYDKDPEGDFAFQQVDGHNTFSELSYMLDAISPGALIIAVISLLILILWETKFMKGLGFTKIVQGPLVVVVGSILIALGFEGTSMKISADHFVKIPVAESFTGFFEFFTLPDFTQITNPQVYGVAIIMAVVASLETLLCVEATDKLDPQKRITPTNRELIAQGVGNITSGMIGGLPITQVIVRSSANIQSGGKTKASAFFHGLLLLGCAMAIPKVLNMIPYAALAAILLVVGYKLAKPALFKEMFKKGWIVFIPFIVTIGGIIFLDLLKGIGLGMAVAVVQILYNNYKLPYHFDPKKYKKGEPILIELSEDVSFLNKASIEKTLNLIPENAHVIIDATSNKHIHPDIMDILHDFEVVAAQKNIQLELREVSKQGSTHPGKGMEKVLADI